MTRHGARRHRYFTTLFVLRAVAKAAPSLRQYDYATGDFSDDAATRSLVRELLDAQPPASSCDAAAADNAPSAAAAAAADADGNGGEDGRFDDSMLRGEMGFGFDDAAVAAAPICREGFDQLLPLLHVTVTS